HRYLQSFPTRRSSDLFPRWLVFCISPAVSLRRMDVLHTTTCICNCSPFCACCSLSSINPTTRWSCCMHPFFRWDWRLPANIQARSEEHTSELQSRENL